MGKYNFESLKAINEMYHHEHRISEADIEKANTWVSFIEGNRNQNVPQLGDVVEFTDRHGSYYENAHIDSVEGDQFYICEKPHVPFLSRTKDRSAFSMETSGGAWTHIPRELKYVGKRMKAFKDWGVYGPCANGAIQFMIEVNVWAYEEAELEFTTKTHDQFFLSILEEPTDFQYKYIITKYGSSHTAFRTKEEYEAWLKTFRGVELEGFDTAHRFIWTFKQGTTYVPLEKYQSIQQAVIDSELSNGTIQECKRIYEGTSVLTIMPFQHEKIALEGERCYRNSYAV